MNLSYLKNNKGLTLTELIIGLGITSVLMIAIISGSLFVEQYLNRWTGSSKLLDELAFVQSEITRNVEISRQVQIFADSIICTLPSARQRRYTWPDGHFYRDSKLLSHKDFIIDSVVLRKMILHSGDSVSILEEAKDSSVAGLYKLTVVVSDGKGSSDRLESIIKNHYEYIKYQQN